MPDIETFSFNKEKFEQIKKYKFGLNWPVVYLIENGKEAYIGETTDIHSRSKQHIVNPDRLRLKNLHVISDEEYNKSAALDIESLLIQYMSADGIFKLQNGNAGLQNHNYYDRDKYKAKFELIWERLKKMSLVQKDLVQIKNSDIFKYSPYKALTEDQIMVVRDIYENIKLDINRTHIVNGKPGTGKTILAVYLVKFLQEQVETKNLKVGLVVPMTALRNTIRKVFRDVPGLKPNMVIGPSDVVKDHYDILIVDEAHRLKRRVNITNYQSFDNINKKLGFGNEGTEIDWIMRSSKYQIFLYDENQSVKPTDVSAEQLKKLNATYHNLTSQLRVEAGDEYIEFIEDLFDLQPVHHYKFPNYDFKIYDHVHEMVQDIKEKDKQFGLSRIVAGYAWPWRTKDNSYGYDIEIGESKLVWNSTIQNWVNSPNAINEVGCIHTVQGYDLNYVGVIIGPELSYDEDKKRLVVDRKKYMDINGHRGISDPAELERYIINIYKTLLTRGIKGTYVYVCDPGFRDLVRKILNEKEVISNS